MAIITKCFCFFLFLVIVVSKASNPRYHITVRRAWHKVLGKHQEPPGVWTIHSSPRLIEWELLFVCLRVHLNGKMRRGESDHFWGGNI